MQLQDNYLVLASILYYERGIKPATGMLVTFCLRSTHIALGEGWSSNFNSSYMAF
jgi:hypothetical protein